MVNDLTTFYIVFAALVVVCIALNVLAWHAATWLTAWAQGKLRELRLRLEDS